MNEKIVELSDALFFGTDAGDLIASCTTTALTNPDEFVRFARTLAQGGPATDGVDELRVALARAKNLPKTMRRHLLVCAARELLLSGKHERQEWLASLGCSDAMAAQGDKSLIDNLRPHYRFAEFLCYARALLVGVDASMPDCFLPGGHAADEVLPHRFGLRVDDALALLGVVDDDELRAIAEDDDMDTDGLMPRSAFEAHPVLKQWLENALDEQERPAAF